VLQRGYISSCSVLQCEKMSSAVVIYRYIVLLQCPAACCRACTSGGCSVLQRGYISSCSVLQCEQVSSVVCDLSIHCLVTVCCNVLQCVYIRRLQCVAECVAV